MAADKKMINFFLVLVHMLLHKVDGMVADMAANKKIMADKVADMVPGRHGCWLIGPKLFSYEAYLTCVISKLCEFINLLQYHVNTV